MNDEIRMPNAEKLGRSANEEGALPTGLVEEGTHS
jgi:hypothetical protein